MFLVCNLTPVEIKKNTQKTYNHLFWETKEGFF